MNSQLIDTHCHLYLPEFSADLDQVMKRASAKAVTKFYLPAIHSDYTAMLLALEARYPDHCRAMMGLHPCYVKDDYEKELEAVESLLRNRPFAAIGEIGLDYYWDQRFKVQQLAAFTRQLKWGLDHQLPVVIHSRESVQDCIDTVRLFATKGLTGIFHCFSGTAEQADAIIGMGFYLGIGGVLTYKNSGLASAIDKVSMDRIVLETDAPYLAPVPYRGKRNEPAYLWEVAQKLAVVKGISIDEIAAITSANAMKIFRM
ncbi:MAG: TatD family hydrolase [Flavitalea sp.]